MKAGRVKEVTFQGVGHLIPMEVVGRTAEACADWVEPEVERWEGLEEGERREWEKVPSGEKAKFSKEYEAMMRRDWVGRLLKGEEGKALAVRTPIALLCVVQQARRFRFLWSPSPPLAPKTILVLQGTDSFSTNLLHRHPLPLLTIHVHPHPFNPTPPKTCLAHHQHAPASRSYQRTDSRPSASVRYHTAR